jgi:hypothetical protein
VSENKVRRNLPLAMMSSIGSLMVSNIKHLQLQNPFLETRRNGLVVEMVMTQSAGTSEVAGLDLRRLMASG